jgi:hypothetical protein
VATTELNKQTNKQTKRDVISNLLFSFFKDFDPKRSIEGVDFTTIASLADLVLNKEQQAIWDFWHKVRMQLPVSVSMKLTLFQRFWAWYCGRAKSGNAGVLEKANIDPAEPWTVIYN